MQINLQHSRVATGNLMKLTQQVHTDIVFIQEPYLYQYKTAGSTGTHRIYTSNEEKHRTNIIANVRIDAVLINQLSDWNTVVIEMRYKNIGILTASMHFDLNEEIDKKRQGSKKSNDAPKAAVSLSPWTAIPDQLHGTTAIQITEAKHWKYI
jgi:hypothetical protein